VANGISAAGSGWGATLAGLSAVVLTIAFRRWRHLLVFLCSLFLLQVTTTLITAGTIWPPMSKALRLSTFAQGRGYV
jgi:hypothetical protein